jgi:nuclear control of ATPase protein 2
MRNLISGRIARLVLIQLQFVKKELLVAMQAIDELFNANQVNLQLLAVTPAILAIIAFQVLGRLVTAIVKASSRGRGIESLAAVHRDIRHGLRDMERLLLMSSAFHDAVQGEHGGLGRGSGASYSNSNSYSDGHHHLMSNHHLIDTSEQLSSAEYGQLLSLLHRLHLLLMVHSGSFDTLSLLQLQEDLRDITTPHLNVRQRLEVIERIHRQYAFLQSTRLRLFGTGFIP